MLIKCSIVFYKILYHRLKLQCKRGDFALTKTAKNGIINVYTSNRKPKY